MKELWNKLSKQERYALLVKVYPARSWELHDLEAKLKWNKLLPSTQKDLEKFEKWGPASGKVGGDAHE